MATPFHQRLRTARTARQLTQLEAAALLGCSLRHYHALESGSSSLPTQAQADAAMTREKALAALKTGLPNNVLSDAPASSAHLNPSANTDS